MSWRSGEWLDMGVWRGGIGRIVLWAGGGAGELAEESKRHRRSFLPAALRGALWKALLASPRKTSWMEAHPAAVERSLSPVQNSELCLMVRYFRPRINSRWEPGGRPSQGRKWRKPRRCTGTWPRKPAFHGPDGLWTGIWPRKPAFHGPDGLWTGIWPRKRAFRGPDGSGKRFCPQNAACLWIGGGRK